MKVKIKYFAAMREACDKSEEIIDTNAQTPLELYEEISKLYPIHIDVHSLKVAINETYSDFKAPLSEMDTIVFIPPVAGG